MKTGEIAPEAKGDLDARQELQVKRAVTFVQPIYSKQRSPTWMGPRLRGQVAAGPASP